MLVAMPFIFLLAVCVGSICYGSLFLNDKEGHFFLFIMNLFVTMAVAESGTLPVGVHTFSLTH